jgi:AbrB family looped-hinge helix DNA binding protein
VIEANKKAPIEYTCRDRPWIGGPARIQPAPRFLTGVLENGKLEKRIRFSDYLLFRNSATPMSKIETAKVGRRGTLVVPASLRKRLQIEEGSLVLIEEREGGFLVRPAVAVPIEVYSPERRAEFLLSNTLDARDYASAAKEVRRMGLDPRKIPHAKPIKR